MNKKLVWYILGGVLLGLLTVSLVATVALRINAVPAADEEKAEAIPTTQPTSTPTPPSTPAPKTYTISFIGDCTLASSQYNNDFEKKMNGDYSYPFKNTVKYFKNDNLTVANLECSFSDKNMTSDGTFYFLAPTSFANILVDGSVEFVTTANNHRHDFAEAGIADTEAALDAVGVNHAGENETYIYDMDGVKVGYYCLINRLVPSTRLVTKGIESLRAQGAEYIICALHWGVEGSYKVTADQKSVAHAAIDAGANVVYGSHPHVLQPIEEYDGGLILYSMGNWSFGGNTSPRDRDTAIVQLKVIKNPNGTLTTGEYEVIPCCLSSVPSVNDYCPTPYEKDSEEYKRTLTKLDGTWTGKDLNVDYSHYHQNSDTTSTPSTKPTEPTE